MLIPISYFGKDDELKKLTAQLSELVNGRIDTDNLQGKFITGTTSSSADTSKLFRHNLLPKPVAVIPAIGDVYVAAIDKDNIDIRSRLADHSFEVFLLQGKKD